MSSQEASAYYCYQELPTAFSLTEIKEPLNFQTFNKRLESYLGEYRFRLPKYPYELQWQGGIGLFDQDTGESMIDKGKRAVLRMEKIGKGQREKAELEGLEKIKEDLFSSQLGDVLIWVSPPGDKEDGYGDYGFFFLGMVDDAQKNYRHLSMVARRVEKRDLEKYNSALSEIVGGDLDFKTPEDFLKNPFILKGGMIDPEKIIDFYFGKIDESIWDKFTQSMKQLEPLKQKIFQLFKDNSIMKLQRLFNALENLSIEYSRSQAAKLPSQTLFDPQIISFYSYKPPTALGSCGPSSDSEDAGFLKTPNSILKLSVLETPFEKMLKTLGLKDEDKDEFGSLKFYCPVCNSEHVRPRHVLLKVCPNKKDENGEFIPIPKC